MQKLLLLLSLLYFVSSKSYCESFDILPSKKKDCHDREILTPNLAKCCYVTAKVDGAELNVCVPGPKKAKKEDLVKVIEDSDITIIKEHEYEITDFDCSSSYIKVGLLLLALLLF